MEKLAKWTVEWAGSTTATILSFVFVIGWIVIGFFHGFDDSYQMIINTSTTIVTFLMVFLIQRQQNKESKAIHLKLNELLAAVSGSSSLLINLEELTEAQLADLDRRYKALVKKIKAEQEPTRSHSVEEI